MTSDEIRTNHLIFETVGALALSCFYGFVLWLSGFSHGAPSSEPGPGQFFYDLFISNSCYLGLVYVLDRVAVRWSWEIRINWLLVAFLGTTLLTIAYIVPLVLVGDGYHVRSFEQTLFFAMAVTAVLNVISGVVMGIVTLLGYLFRCIV